MRTFSLRRTIFLLLLAACLALPWPAAAAPRKEAPASAHSAFLSQAWSFLQGLWADAGCWIDPDGRCVTGNTQPATDTGCGLDPGGRCVTGGASVAHPNPPSLDEGCGLDPGGLCRG